MNKKRTTQDRYQAVRASDRVLLFECAGLLFAMPIDVIDHVGFANTEGENWSMTNSDNGFAGTARVAGYERALWDLGQMLDSGSSRIAYIAVRIRQGNHEVPMALLTGSIVSVINLPRANLRRWPQAATRCRPGAIAGVFPTADGTHLASAPASPNTYLLDIKSLFRRKDFEESRHAVREHVLQAT